MIRRRPAKGTCRGKAPRAVTFRTFHGDGANAVLAARKLLGGMTQVDHHSRRVTGGDRGVRGSIVRQAAGRQRPRALLRDERAECNPMPCRTVRRSDLGVVKTPGSLGPTGRFAGSPKKGAGFVVGRRFARGVQNTRNPRDVSARNLSDRWQKSIRHISLRGRKLARLARGKSYAADAVCDGTEANGCAGPYVQSGKTDALGSGCG